MKAVLFDIFTNTFAFDFTPEAAKCSFKGFVVSDVDEDQGISEKASEEGEALDSEELRLQEPYHRQESRRMNL